MKVSSIPLSGKSSCRFLDKTFQSGANRFPISRSSCDFDWRTIIETLNTIILETHHEFSTLGSCLKYKPGRSRSCFTMNLDGTVGCGNVSRCEKFIKPSRHSSMELFTWKLKWTFCERALTFCSISANKAILAGRVLTISSASVILEVTIPRASQMVLSVCPSLWIPARVVTKYLEPLWIVRHMSDEPFRRDQGRNH